MKITAVRVYPVSRPRTGPNVLLGTAEIELDDQLVIREIRLLRLGRQYRAIMPGRDWVEACPSCKAKQRNKAIYCDQCGAKLPPLHPDKDPSHRISVVFPNKNLFRHQIERAVWLEFERVISGPDPQPNRSAYRAIPA